MQRKDLDTFLPPSLVFITNEVILWGSHVRLLECVSEIHNTMKSFEPLGRYYHQLTQRFTGGLGVIHVDSNKWKKLPKNKRFALSL